MPTDCCSRNGSIEIDARERLGLNRRAARVSIAPASTHSGGQREKRHVVTPGRRFPLETASTRCAQTGLRMCRRMVDRSRRLASREAQLDWARATAQSMQNRAHLLSAVRRTRMVRLNEDDSRRDFDIPRPARQGRITPGERDDPGRRQVRSR